jgi:hypothetical protein
MLQKLQSFMTNYNQIDIAILGTRGVPNYYGGFEQFAEFFAKYCVEKGENILVYNSHNHPFKESIWEGVQISHQFDPEYKLGTFGQFIYDLNCILHLRKIKPKIILQLGYTSSTIWYWLLPRKSSVIITNMDGLEWKRTKYNKWVQKFLKFAENLAVKGSDYFIADSLGIQNYLKNEYGIDSEYIAYGAHLFNNPDLSILKEYNLDPYKYNMLIARIEPENNIEMILDGVETSLNSQKFLVIGKNNINNFGKYLTEKYKNSSKIVFLGGIYDINKLNNLRYYSNLYFHGHSVGGTNPSLLEAMASSTLIIAHDNPFNRGNLDIDAFYFKNSNEVSNHLNVLIKKDYVQLVKSNFEKIKNHYSWEKINSDCLYFLKECIELKKN